MLHRAAEKHRLEGNPLDVEVQAGGHVCGDVRGIFSSCSKQDTVTYSSGFSCFKSRGATMAAVHLLQ